MVGRSASELVVPAFTRSTQRSHGGTAEYEGRRAKRQASAATSPAEMLGKCESTGGADYAGTSSTDGLHADGVDSAFAVVYRPVARVRSIMHWRPRSPTWHIHVEGKFSLTPDAGPHRVESMVCVPSKRQRTTTKLSSPIRRSMCIRLSGKAEWKARGEQPLPALNKSLIGTCTPAQVRTAWTWHFKFDRSPTSFARCRTQRPDPASRAGNPGFGQPAHPQQIHPNDLPSLVCSARRGLPSR
jgi:hypothetical protein